MTEQSHTQQQLPQTQIWSQLGGEQRAWIIQIIAQLVIKLLVAQSENKEKGVGNVASE